MSPSVTSRALPALLSLAAACTVGDATGGGADAAPADCDPAVTELLPTGNHNPGLECIVAGCHGEPLGALAPPWTAAGTLYSSATGDAIVAGATIRLTDANGAKIELVTALNGNFYTEEALAFPLTSEASICPDKVAMVATIPGPVASCNAGACHDAALRMHVP